MSVAIATELLLKFGLPLTVQLVQWHKEGKQTVTPEDMQTLLQLANYSSAESLRNAGIRIVDGKAVPA